MRFAAPRSLICKRVAGTIGSLLPPRSRHFGRVQRCLLVYRPPMRAAWASSFRELASSSKCYVNQPAPAILADRESSSLGVPSLIATSAPASTTPESPTSGHVPPSAFLTPSTVCSASTFAGLFHPAATFRVCPAGVCPHRGAVPAFTGRIMPSCWLNPGRLRFDPRQHTVLPTSRLCSPR
jgi:hypothetical protein